MWIWEIYLKEDREDIRQTWGRPTILGVNTRLVFLLGEPHNPPDQDLLVSESAKYGDIIQGSFLDSYQNLTYKNIMGKVWVSEFCSQAEFVIKTDDDTYIDLCSVYSVTRKYLNTEVMITLPCILN